LIPPPNITFTPLQYATVTMATALQHASLLRRVFAAAPPRPLPAPPAPSASRAFASATPQLRSSYVILRRPASAPLSHLFEHRQMSLLFLILNIVEGSLFQVHYH